MTPSPKAIPVGHTQPLTTAQYKPASQPGARPNTNFKAGSQPANAGKPASPANPVANKPANNAEAAKPADPGNPAASKPANHAEASKPANPPANENHAAQPPNKVTPPPPHNANPGANNSNPNTKPNPEAAGIRTQRLRHHRINSRHRHRTTRIPARTTATQTPSQIPKPPGIRT